MHLRTTLIGLLVTSVLSSPLSVDKKGPSSKLTNSAVDFVRATGIDVRQDRSGCPMINQDIGAATQKRQDWPSCEDPAEVWPLCSDNDNEERDDVPTCADPDDIWPFCDGPDDDKRDGKHECPDPDDTWPFCDSHSDRSISERGEDDPLCLCVSEAGQCLHDTQQACYSAANVGGAREYAKQLLSELLQETADHLKQLTDAVSSKRQAEPFCACATHGNGTCIDETEYCLDHPDLPPHKPVCVCAIDTKGYCKEGTTFCSDNVQTGNSRRKEGGDDGSNSHDDDDNNDEQWCVALPSAAGIYTPIEETCARDADGVRDLISKRQTDNKPADCVCLTPECNEPEGVWCFSSMQKESLCDCSAYEGCTAAAKLFCHFTGGVKGNGDHKIRLATVDDSRSQLTKRQGVHEDIAPSDPNPTDGASTWDGGFGIVMYPATEWGYLPPDSWHTLDSQCYPKDWFLMTLTDGKLEDTLGRRGYIASNGQLQFDDPPQAGAKYTSGFYTWGGVLGIGSNYTWWACSSGGFSNIYSEHYANYCQPVWLKMNMYDGECATDDSE